MHLLLLQPAAPIPQKSMHASFLLVVLSRHHTFRDVWSFTSSSRLKSSLSVVVVNAFGQNWWFHGSQSPRCALLLYACMQMLHCALCTNVLVQLRFAGQFQSGQTCLPQLCCWEDHHRITLQGWAPPRRVFAAVLALESCYGYETPKRDNYFSMMFTYCDDSKLLT